MLPTVVIEELACVAPKLLRRLGITTRRKYAPPTSGVLARELQTNFRD
jgi:hypothetical protein